MTATTHETGLYNRLSHSQHTNAALVLDSVYNTLRHQNPSITLISQSDSGYSELPPRTNTSTESWNGQYSTLSGATTFRTTEKGYHIQVFSFHCY